MKSAAHNFARWAMPVWIVASIACLCSVLNLAMAPIAAGTEQAPTAAAGQQLFEKRCSGCHTATRAKEGPPLAGVLGRKAGSVAGFPYSDELKAANIIWDKTNLERWLAGPEKMVPNTDMSFKVDNPPERAALVEYLSVLK